MKITLTFKCPDALSDALSEVDHDIRNELYEKLSKKFFRWGEYVNVSVDTDTLKAEVEERS